MTKIKSSKKLLTLEDLSKEYSFSLSTLRRWASERKFPLYRVSNRIRVSVEEWEEWLEHFHLRSAGGTDE